MVSKKALWDAQLKLWPESEKVSLAEMYAWADQGCTIQNKLSRWKLIAMTRQYTNVIFYRTHKTLENCWLGCRYGTKPGDYLSGFSTVERMS